MRTNTSESINSSCSRKITVGHTENRSRRTKGRYVELGWETVHRPVVGARLDKAAQRHYSGPSAEGLDGHEHRGAVVYSAQVVSFHFLPSIQMIQVEDPPLQQAVLLDFVAEALAAIFAVPAE